MRGQTEHVTERLASRSPADCLSEGRGGILCAAGRNERWSLRQHRQHRLRPPLGTCGVGASQLDSCRRNRDMPDTAPPRKPAESGNHRPRTRPSSNHPSWLRNAERHAPLHSCQQLAMTAGIRPTGSRSVSLSYLATGEVGSHGFREYRSTASLSSAAESRRISCVLQRSRASCCDSRLPPQPASQNVSAQNQALAGLRTEAEERLPMEIQGGL